MKTLLTLTLSACLITGCATRGDGDFQGERQASSVEEAAMTPISDLNLDKVDIPEYLLTMIDPYSEVSGGCALTAEIVTLNGLLGEDLDVPEELAERREATAYKAAGETVGSVLIPFRGVVRAVSGASSHDRKAREAYQRGLVRRAYLKGLATERGCTIPTLG